MKGSSVIQKIISAITTLGQNAIPLGAVLLSGNTSQTAMVMYFLETLLAITLALIFVRMRAPAEDTGYANVVSSRSQVTVNGRVSYRYQPRNRRTMLQNFLLISLGFSLIPGIFIITFLSLILHADISRAAIISGMAGIAFFQIVNFIAEFFTLGVLTPESATDYLTQVSGRSALIYISVFAGMILAAFVQNWFIVPFGLLKTLADLSFIFRKR